MRWHKVERCRNASKCRERFWWRTNSPTNWVPWESCYQTPTAWAVSESLEGLLRVMVNMQITHVAVGSTSDMPSLIYVRSVPLRDGLSACPVYCDAGRNDGRLLHVQVFQACVLPLAHSIRMAAVQFSSWNGRWPTRWLGMRCMCRCILHVRLIIFMDVFL